MSQSYWREKASEIIMKVLNDNPGKCEQDIRKILTSAYPFGERSNHPYKIWLDEIKIRLNEKKDKDDFLKLWGFDGK